MIFHSNLKGILIPIAFIVVLGLMAACGGGNSDSAPNEVLTTPPPTELPPAPPLEPGMFVDATASSGIDFRAGFTSELTPRDIENVAFSSVASGDYDNDGDIDLFIVHGENGANLLYRNTGNMVFEEVAEAAGVAYTKSATENYKHGGTMFADMDGDGDLDLFLGGLDGDPSLIFENNGNGTFTDVTTGSGIDGMRATHTISAAFGDYDLDGYLDLFVAHWGTDRDFSAPGDTEHLWRNVTDAAGIKFQSVSEAARISPSILTLPDPYVTQAPLWDFTFAPTFARINDDLYPDILIVSDFNYSQYFVNNQDGTFTNATDTNVMIDGNGMGSAVADYDNDGDLDWFVTSILCRGDECIDGSVSQIGNRLYRNVGGAFEDVTDAAGVASGGWGWGACFIDFENDGDLDIYHTNGYLYVTDDNDFSSDPSRAFVANGTGQFERRAADIGLNDREDGRGVVCADFDNDGDVDILQLHRAPNVAATLWRNDANSNNFLGVKLNGVAPNTEATGARVTIIAAGATQMREISIASNFASQNPTIQIFGLGSAVQVDVVTIEWPDGQSTVLNNVQAGQSIVVDHPDL